MAKARRVAIRVASIHDGEKIEQETEGDWYVRPGGHMLRYPEPDPSMGDTMTMVKCTEGEVRISRQGDNSSELGYRDRAEAVGRYRLPDGWVSVRTNTRRLNMRWTETGGEIRLDYVLYMAEREVGHFELTVRATML